MGIYVRYNGSQNPAVSHHLATAASVALQQRLAKSLCIIYEYDYYINSASEAKLTNRGEKFKIYVHICLENRGNAPGVRTSHHSNAHEQ